MISGDITIAAGEEGTLSATEGNTIFEPDDELIRGLGFTQSSVKINKAYNIYHQIGICPILACGNSDGDFSMLNYAKSNPNYKSLALLINHDDDIREYAYNTTERAEWDAYAEEYGWNVVSMKDEFEVIFLKDEVKID